MWSSTLRSIGKCPGTKRKVKEAELVVQAAHLVAVFCLLRRNLLLHLARGERHSASCDERRLAQKNGGDPPESYRRIRGTPYRAEI